MYGPVHLREFDTSDLGLWPNTLLLSPKAALPRSPGAHAALLAQKDHPLHL